MDSTAHDDDVAAFAGRVFQSVLGGFETLSVYVGDRLGLYRLLRDAGPLSPGELSERAPMNARYAREWLEQQAVSGVLVVSGEGDERRFALPPAHAAVLADPQSLAFSAPLARMMMAAASRMPELLAAYRTGGGVAWSDYGSDARDAQGDVNRPWLERALAPALHSVPSISAVLARPDARIADVGCGHGWSTIGLARAHPNARVTGFDVDAVALESARGHAAGAAEFEKLGGERLADGRAGTFDAAFIFEALHDMPDPVGVLAALRRAVKDDGIVVVMDEAVAEAFTPDGDEIERIMYGYSLFLCLPDSLSTPGSVGTGTVMRPATLEHYARDAGFSGVEVLPIDDFAAFRFYQLNR